MTWIDVGEGSTASKDLNMGEGDALEFDWDGNEQPTAPSVRMNARSAIVSANARRAAGYVVFFHSISFVPIQSNVSAALAAQL